jgi:hypothetical protein
MTNPRHMNVVAEIKKRHGNIIDLDKSPMAIIEIIHNYRYLLDEVADNDGAGGGKPDPPPPPPPPPRDGGSETLLNLLLEVRREVQAISARIK